MKPTSGKVSAGVLWVVLLSAVAAAGGYYGGRYLLGEEYLKKNASQVRTPEPIPVTPSPSYSASADRGEPVATITPLRPPRPRREPGASTDESQGDQASGGAGETEQPAQPEQLTIQLGSFADKANADLLVQDLKQHGVTASASGTDQEGRTLYRVYTGRFAGRQKAEAAAEQLRQRGYNAIIVPRE